MHRSLHEPVPLSLADYLAMSGGVHPDADVDGPDDDDDTGDTEN